MAPARPLFVLFQVPPSPECGRDYKSCTKCVSHYQLVHMVPPADEEYKTRLQCEYHQLLSAPDRACAHGMPAPSPVLVAGLPCTTAGCNKCVKPLSWIPPDVENPLEYQDKSCAACSEGFRRAGGSCTECPYACARCNTNVKFCDVCDEHHWPFVKLDPRSRQCIPFELPA